MAPTLVLLCVLSQTGTVDPMPPDSPIPADPVLPDGWTKERPDKKEETPRLLYMLVNRKTGARISVVLGDPYWTSPPTAVGRMAQWMKAAGYRIEMLAGVRNRTEHDADEASFNWHDPAAGASGRMRFARLRTTYDEGGKEERAPILQMTGRWPSKHHKKSWIAFDDIFHALIK